MSLSTPIFLIFFAICASVYLKIPAKYQPAWLLLASMAFYMWSMPAYGGVLIATAGLAYLAGLRIAAAEGETKKRRLAAYIIFFVAVLCIFKYFNSTVKLLGLSGAVSLAQPVGISFYTLSVIGYLVDVAHGDEPEKNFIVFALYISYFPQIISGPIARSGELLPQLRAEHRYDYDRTVQGLERFLIGAFKKLVLSNGLGLLVDGVWADLEAAQGLSVAAAFIIYPIQLYCDFSGYTDMALGVSQVLGIKLRENFCAPFFATNFSGFWSRWHMSLSSWLQDYIFVPLAWADTEHITRGKMQHLPVYACIFAVFFTSGLWHGVGMTFVVWGLLQALYRMGEELMHRHLGKPKKKAPARIIWGKRVAVFALWVFSMVFFRAPSLGDAAKAFSELGNPGTFSHMIDILYAAAAKSVFADRKYFMIYTAGIAIGLVAAVIFDVIDFKRGPKKVGERRLEGLSSTKKWLVCWMLGLLCCAFYLISITGTAAGAAFIYGGY